MSFPLRALVALIGAFIVASNSAFAFVLTPSPLPSSTPVKVNRLGLQPIVDVARAPFAPLCMTSKDEDGSDSKDKDSEEGRQLRLRAATLGTNLKGTNLYFVGMMGTGKTSVAKGLAELLGKYSFIDTDAIIEKVCHIVIAKCRPFVCPFTSKTFAVPGDATNHSKIILPPLLHSS